MVILTGYINVWLWDFYKLVWNTLQADMEHQKSHDAWRMFSLMENVNITTMSLTLALNGTSEATLNERSVGDILGSLYFWLFGVVLCVIAIIGIITNSVNVYALTLTIRTSKRPMYYCLLCMAVVDKLVSLIHRFNIYYIAYGFIQKSDYLN